ncbi:MAG: hypothetical protein CMM02_08460 [Rhodopirellula sp.]|jgi:hypothetical protein|nr:hypothetical protein [Rhodopirellula sp.]
MIDPIKLEQAKAVKLLIEPRGDLVESEVYQVYKDGKQLTLKEINADIIHLVDMENQGIENLVKGLVG